ncbi:MAG: IS200/IS605 family transposase [Candidatus Methanosuratincola verstraetei]|jgi:putative transposase
MKYKLDKSSHAVFSLQYHLVLVVKYRRKVLCNETIRERLKNIIWNLARQLDIEIIAQEPAEDHVHVLFKAKPSTDLVKVVNTLKGVTARLLRKEFPQLQNLLWGNSFWSDSYFIASTGQVSLDVLKKYVEEQESA